MKCPAPTPHRPASARLARWPRPTPRRAAPRTQLGQTLVSLLVGLALAGLVLSGAAQMLAQLVRSQQHTLQTQRLQQELHFALDLLGRELQDAQYSASAWRTRSEQACSDDFCNGSEDFSIGPERLDWTLDRDHNGVQDKDECTGFRVKSGALQVRTACTPEVWTALSDPNKVRLLHLQASVQCSLHGGWLKRQVRVQLQAQSPQDPSRTLTLQRQLPLHNDLPASLATRYCP